MRDMFVLNSGVGSRVSFEGREYAYFGGNDYLGLANHRVVKDGAVTAIEKYGANFAASRRTTGTCELHLRLEALLATFKGQQDAIVFASGYLGNTILLRTLQDRFDAVFADELCHPSVRDGIPADIREVRFYRHLDVGHLETLLKKNRNKRVLAITDGVFALTGEIAPLREMACLLESHKGMLVVDDAHGVGVLGETGKGSLEHCGLSSQDPVFQIDTMSKALGAFGGFIAGSGELVARIKSTSPAFAGSTALPPPVVGAGLGAVTHLIEHPERRTQLIEHAKRAKARIGEMGYGTFSHPTPIIPLLFDKMEQAAALTAFLKENGIIAPLIDYPVGIDKHLIRITLSASHTHDQIHQLLALLESWRDRNDVNPDQNGIC